MTADPHEQWAADRRRLSEAYSRHFEAIGRIAHAWNELHENLCSLFVQLSMIDQGVGASIWFSLQSDRSQRNLIRAVLGAPVLDERWPQFPTLQKDVATLLKLANQVADYRNNALHSPFMMALVGSDDAATFLPSPETFMGNPRAQALSDKDLAAEFAWYARSASHLSAVADNMAEALRDAEHPWPKISKLPPHPHPGARSRRG